MVAQGAGKSRIHALTGIRAIAAVGVIAYHFNTEFTALIPGWSSLSWLIVQGGLGVDLFFLLSGFILTHTYWGRFVKPCWGEYFKFVWLRFARIYPAYLVTLLVAVAIVLVARSRGIQFSAASYPTSVLLPEFLLILGWWNPDGIGGGWNYPDWSVSAEWFAYLFIFPAAMFLVSRITARWLCGMLVVLPLTALSVTTSLSVWPGSRSLWMVSNLFLAGGFVRALRERLWRNHAPGRYVDVACVFACLGALTFHEVLKPGVHGALVHLSFASLILALSAAQGPVTALLSSKVFVYLGEISYSLYLSHGIVQRVLKVALPFNQFDASGGLVRLGVAAAYWITILASAAALYHLVEKPGRDYCRRLYELCLLSRVRNQPISR